MRQREPAAALPLQPDNINQIISVSGNRKKIASLPKGANIASKDCLGSGGSNLPPRLLHCVTILSIDADSLVCGTCNLATNSCSAFGHPGHIVPRMVLPIARWTTYSNLCRQHAPTDWSHSPLLSSQRQRLGVSISCSTLYGQPAPSDTTGVSHGAPGVSHGTPGVSHGTGTPPAAV